jgi:hypothetical protein
MTRRLVVLLVVVGMLAAACTSAETTSPTAAPSATSSAVPALVLPASLVTFGNYRVVPLPDDPPPYPGPRTPKSLADVEYSTTPGFAALVGSVGDDLVRQGFVVVPEEFRFMHAAYDGASYQHWPVYLTTDAATHTWHLVFDKLLRDVEQQTLLPRLRELVTGLEAGATRQVARLEGTEAQPAASRAAQLYQVAAATLGLPVTPGRRAQRELALIAAHDKEATSPVTGARVDYGVFVPRGHYTRTAELTRYFVGMSVLGQLGLCLPGSFECPGVAPARVGILASRVLAADKELTRLWRRIYQPVAFLVGVSDDYTPLEVAAAVRRAAPGGMRDPSVIADDAVVGRVVDDLTSTRSVAINPERASIRVMGTRFVIDSFIFDQLIYPNVGTASNPRLLPSALDLPAAFGSRFAYRAMKREGLTDYARYREQLGRMRDAVAARPPKDWGGTVYDAWIYSLEPSFVRHGKAFPDYMRSKAWAAKTHQSALGSYAELKHDTLLYAKQAFGEAGDGVVVEPRSWVEPEPVSFLRLQAMSELMRSGLTKRGLLTDEQSKLLVDLENLFGFFGRIAEDELAGRPLATVDNDRLKSVGEELEALWMRSADQSSKGWVFARDLDPAIVADVAGSVEGALEVATGRFNRIYVLVPKDDGTFQVASGGVYSYYEFVNDGPLLTDETWRAMLDSGEAPERPAWESPLFPRP